MRGLIEKCRAWRSSAGVAYFCQQFSSSFYDGYFHQLPPATRRSDR